MDRRQMTSGQITKRQRNFQAFYQSELEKQLFQFLEKYYEEYDDRINYLELIRTFNLSEKSIKKMELKFKFSYINLSRGEDDYQINYYPPSDPPSENQNNIWVNHSDISFDFYNNPTDIETLIEINERNDYSMTEISANPAVDFNLVLKYPDLHWKYGNFTERGFDMWYSKGLSGNQNITIDIIKNNPEKPWNYYIILKTTEFNANNFDDILSYCKNKLQEKNEYIEDTFYRAIANNSTLTYELIKLHPEIEWQYNCYEVFSKYKDIPLEDIYEKIDKFVITHCKYTHDNYEYNGVPIFKNPNMTFDILSNLIDNKIYPYMSYAWHGICINNFNKQKDLIWDDCLYKWDKICKIQEWWMDIYWDPRSSICQKRLYREYDEIVEMFENFKRQRLEWDNELKLAV